MYGNWNGSNGREKKYVSLTRRHRKITQLEINKVIELDVMPSVETVVSARCIYSVAFCNTVKRRQQQQQQSTNKQTAENTKLKRPQSLLESTGYGFN